MYKLADRTRERTSTTGTGDIALNGVLDPTHITFANPNGVGNGNTTRYCLLSGNGIDWEVGDNALVTAGSPDILQRNTEFSFIGGVYGTSPISLTGESRVFCALPATVSGFTDSGNWDGTAAFARNSVVRFGDKRYIASEPIAAAPSGAPTIDGHAKHNGTTTGSPVTLALTTTLADDEIVVVISINGGKTAVPTATGLTFTERMSGLGTPIRNTIGGITIQEFTARSAAVLSGKVITITPSGSADFSAVAFGVHGVNSVYAFDTDSDHIPLATAGNTVVCDTDGHNLFLVYLDVSANISFNPAAVPTSFTIIESCTYVPAQMGVSGRSVTAQQVGVSLVGSAGASVLAFVDALTSENAPPNKDSRWVPLGDDPGDQAANSFFAGPASGGSGAALWRSIVALDLPAMVGDSGTGGTKGAAPAPAAGDAAAGKYLSAAGSYSVPPGSSSGTVTSVGTGTGLSGGPITSIGTISVDTAVIATRAYVDALLPDFELKNPVHAATTAALLFSPTYSNGSSGVGATLTGSAGVLILDGYTPALGDSLLIKNQASAFQNGVYTVTTLGTISVGYVLTRRTDFNNAASIVYGDTVFVLNGTTNQNQQFTMSNNTAIVVGTTAINFAQTSGGSQLTSGTGILITGNSVALAPAAAHTFKGNNTAGSAVPTDLTATQLAAELAIANIGDAAITSPADNDVLVYIAGSSKWTNKRSHYGVGFSAPQITAYTASQVIGHHRAACAFTIPANFGSYLNRSSRAGGSTVTTASTVFSVEKAAAATPNTFSQIGTITFALGTVTPTFATSGGTTISFAANDVLRIVAPGTPDVTFAGFYATIAGFET